MQQIILQPEPRTTQIVALESKKFEIGIDYNETNDTWTVNVKNIATGNAATGLIMQPGRAILLHHRTILGITGDIFAVPEGVSNNTVLERQKITWCDLTNGKANLYYINPNELGL